MLAWLIDLLLAAVPGLDAAVALAGWAPYVVFVLTVMALRSADRFLVGQLPLSERLVTKGVIVTAIALLVSIAATQHL